MPIESTTKLPSVASVEVLEIADLARIASEWNELAANALEPNPFHEPWFLAPALAAFAADDGGAPVSIATVRVDDVLACVLPFRAIARYRGLPVRALATWRNLYDPLATPLVHRDHARAALGALLDWMEARREVGIELSNTSGDGAFRCALVDVLRERTTPLCTVESHSRAVFRSRADAEQYLEAVLKGRRRKEYRRLERRLAEQGELKYRVVRSAEEAAAFTTAFVALEAAGWKGEAGTAFSGRPKHRLFFEEVVLEAARRGKFDGFSLELDGRPIAMQCSLMNGNVYFAWKVAYDETLARFSPGVLLEIENIRRLHDEPNAFMDSCATPDHWISNRLWPDRRLIETVLLPGGRGGEWFVSALPLLQRLKRGARTLLRRG